MSLKQILEDFRKKEAAVQAPKTETIWTKAVIDILLVVVLSLGVVILVLAFLCCLQYWFYMCRQKSVSSIIKSRKQSATYHVKQLVTGTSKQPAPGNSKQPAPNDSKQPAPSNYKQLATSSLIESESYDA
jgi:hypothetical protein